MAEDETRVVLVNAEGETIAEVKPFTLYPLCPMCARNYKPEPPQFRVISQERTENICHECADELQKRPDCTPVP